MFNIFKGLFGKKSLNPNEGLYVKKEIADKYVRAHEALDLMRKQEKKVNRRKNIKALLTVGIILVIIFLGYQGFKNFDRIVTTISTVSVELFHPETSEAVISVTESSSADETPTDCTALTVSIDDSVDSVDVKIGPADGQKFQSGWCYVIAEEDQAKWLDLFRTSGDIKEFAKILAAESGVDLNTAIDALKDSKSSFILDLR